MRKEGEKDRMLRGTQTAIYMYIHAALPIFSLSSPLSSLSLSLSLKTQFVPVPQNPPLKNANPPNVFPLYRDRSLPTLTLSFSLRSRRSPPFRFSSAVVKTSRASRRALLAIAGGSASVFTPADSTWKSLPAGQWASNEASLAFVHPYSLRPPARRPPLLLCGAV